MTKNEALQRLIKLREFHCTIMNSTAFLKTWFWTHHPTENAAL
jgi:hypothetical protein